VFGDEGTLLHVIFKRKHRKKKTLSYLAFQTSVDVIPGLVFYVGCCKDILYSLNLCCNIHKLKRKVKSAFKEAPPKIMRSN
jgi:hypothetical protein